MSYISEGKAQEAREIIAAYEKQERQKLYDREAHEKTRLEELLQALVTTPALETFLLTISEKEHDELRVTSVPREEHILRIKERNLKLLMGAVNQIAWFYQVEPDAFLKMMAELPFKPEIAFDYRSWNAALRKHQKTEERA